MIRVVKIAQKDDTNTKKSLSSQAVLYFLGRSGALAITFLVPVLLVRIFSKYDYGQYAQLLLLYNFFFRILQFGFRQSLYYFLPVNKAIQGYYVINTFIFLVFLGVFFIFFLTMFREAIANLFNAPELSLMLPFCGLHTLFMLLSCSFEPILIINSKAEKASIILILSELIRGISVIIFVLIYKTISSAIFGLLCFSVMRFIAYSIFMGKNFGIRFDKNNLRLMKEQFQYALPIGFSGILSNTHKRIDKLIIAALFAPEIYAIYNIGMLKIPLLDTLFNSVGEVILPRAVNLLKNKKIDQFMELWRKVLIRFSYVGLGAFFVIQLVAYDLFTFIFTIKYEAGVPIFRVAVFVIFGQMLQYGIILRSIGHTGAILKSNLISFLVALPLTFILVHHFGVIGAAISALSAYFINAITQLIYSVKGLNIKTTDIFPINTMCKLAAVGASLFLILFNFQTLIPYKILRIFISTILFIVLYGYICRKINIYNIFEEKYFKKLSSRINFVKT
jgi:O-antigen/teichoic acid export membrane protein